MKNSDTITMDFFKNNPGHLGMSIINIITVPVFLYDRNFNLIFINTATENLLGYSSDEMVGKVWDEIFQLITNVQTTTINQLVFKEHININMRLEILHKKGHGIPAIFSVNPLVDKDGESVGLLVRVEDLRERLKNIELQQFSNFIIDSINSGVIAIDNNSMVTSYNQAAEKITGLKRKDALGKDYEEIFQLIPDVNKFLLKTLTDGSEISNYEFVSEANPDHILCMDTGPIKDDIGFVKGAVGIIRDITEQRSVFQLQQELNFIIDSINAGVTAINEKRQFTTFNKQAELILGLKRSDIIGKKLEEIFPETPKPILIDTLITGQEYSLYEIKMNSKTLSFNTTQIRDDKGDIIGAVGVFIDVTQQKNLEEKMQRAEKLAALGEMAAGTAHEIRNPLTTIKGFLQLMSKKFQKEDVESEYIELMINEVESANNIIKDFLLFSKPMAPDFRQTNINNILEDLRLIVENQAIMREISVIKEFSSELSPVLIDRDQIKQVLVNIIQNAFQAMESRGVLSISTSQDVCGGYVEITIKDTGSGIPRENLSKIFDPFYSTKEVGSGTGLGLTIAYQIIKQHKGEISVSSEIGIGTAFKIKLPVCSGKNNGY